MEKAVYLVCVPGGALYYCARKIQSFLWNKYNLGTEVLPELHLTIDAFFYNDIAELEKIKISLERIVSEIEPFEIHSNGFSHIPEPYNCITVHVVKNESIKNVYDHIHTRMQKNGFKVRDFSPEEIVFHISLAGIHGRAWSVEESKNAWNEINQFQMKEISFIDELQLWLPDTHDPDTRLISLYKLKND